MLNVTAIERNVQQFLIDTTGDTSLTADTDLLSSGLLDSLTMMDLVVFIEVEFQQRIALDDMRPEKFRTIGTIAQLVEKLQAGEHQQAA
jgi:methoxymalonate biosynthesis acyl carrier protein